jgi:hypothetical protein
MRPYRPRPIQLRNVVSHGDWRLKRYTIILEPNAERDRVAEWPDFEPGRALAYATLPDPARTPERLGVGFIIEHRGYGADYVVLAWWDRENEIPIRVVVREHSPGSEFRYARGSESTCVWDLEVIGFERNAYVATVLSGGDQDEAAAAYLSRGLSVGVRPGADAALV